MKISNVMTLCILYIAYMHNRAISILFESHKWNVASEVCGEAVLYCKYFSRSRQSHRV